MESHGLVAAACFFYSFDYNKTVSIRKEATPLVELSITLDEIDFDSVAELLTPVMEGQLQNGSFPAWAKMLLLAGGTNAETVKKLLAKIPESKKEEFLVQAINYKTDQSARKLEDYAVKKGIRLKVTRLGAKKL